jgi:hypothetical protein
MLSISIRPIDHELKRRTTYVVSMEIDKFDRPESLEYLHDIIRSQRVSHTGDKQPVVRDRRVLVLFDIESGRDRESCAQWWELWYV